VAGATVVIAARNAASWIGTQLDALGAQTYDDELEVIVVDNGSRDRTAAVARSRSSHRFTLSVLRAEAQAGPSYARNVGARRATARVVLFCDADDRVGEAWVKAMVDGLGEYDAVGGPRAHEPLNDRRVLRWRPGPPARAGLPLAFEFLPFATSSNLGIRREVFERLGGFDERLFSSEDVDLSWRLQLGGWRLGFVPDAVVAYRRRATVLGTWRQAFRWGVGGERVCRKHLAAGAPGLAPRRLGRSLSRLARAAPRLLVMQPRRVEWVDKVSYDLGMLVERAWWRLTKSRRLPSRAR